MTGKLPAGQEGRPGSFADVMFPPGVLAAARASFAAARCPNTPPCGHGALLHDVRDMDDPLPRCCADGCPCGAAAAIPRPGKPEED